MAGAGACGRPQLHASSSAPTCAIVRGVVLQQPIAHIDACGSRLLPEALGIAPAELVEGVARPGCKGCARGVHGCGV